MSITEQLHSPNETVAEVETAPKQRKRLPTIETNNRQLREKRKDMIEAIAQANEPPSLFHGDDGLTMISNDKDGFPILRNSTREMIQDVMGDAANWISTANIPLKEGGFKSVIKQVMPPRDMAENYLSQRKWPGVPTINGIVTAPVVAADGTICATTGYHPSAKLYLSLPNGFVMPSIEPTSQNVEEAKSLIFGMLLRDVAFADEASSAHAFSLMLLPFVRLLIDGPTPLHLIDAPTQSSGKSYAAEICISPFTTPKASVMKGDDEEWRKAILAALLSGRSHMFLDNIKGQLSSPTLAAAITSPVLTERAMGGLREVSVKVRCVWVATSNNARLDADTASRCVVIRLDTGMENPERRAFNFSPTDYIHENRSEVIGALLTLVRNWQKQGSPKFSGTSQTRFSKWQEVMGGIAECNEITGFLDNLDLFREALDPEKAAWGAFCEAWANTFGSKAVTVTDLLPLALEIPEIAATMGDREGHSQKLRLGKQLGFRRDKVFAQMKICAGLPGRNGATYSIFSTAQPEDQLELPMKSTDSIYGAG